MAARLAVLSVVGWSVALVHEWAEAAGHEVAVVVTVPGPASRPDQHLETLAKARRGPVLMVVPAVRDCEATLRDLSVDLGVVFSFGRVPETVAAIPRHGTVNVHPALLPAYRGPNGYRSLYEGERRIGATLHRLTPQIDAGPILAQASRPTPDDVDPTTAMDALQAAITDTFDAGVPRALADEAGDPQDPSAVTSAPAFSADETVLDLRSSTYLLHCRVAALTLAGIQPSVVLSGEGHPVRAVRRLEGLTAGAPGVVALTARRAVVAVPDGVVELELGKLPF